MTQVVLVEDEPAHQRWLAQCVARLRGARVIGRARSLTEALALVTNPATPMPDLLLLDLELPDGMGLDLLPQVRRWWPTTRVLALSRTSDQRLVVQALRQGVQGYLVKDGDATAVTEAMQAVLQGLYALSPGAAQRLPLAGYAGQSHTARPPAPASAVTLTPREQEVLAALAQGLRYEEVAHALCLSVSTVQSHVRKLYRKLGATSKLGALHRAKALDLLRNAAPMQPAAPAETTGTGA